MHYYIYDMGRAALGTISPAAQAAAAVLSHPFHPLSQTPAGRAAAGLGEVFERSLRHHLPLDLNLEGVALREVAVHPFGRLLHLDSGHDGARPRLLVVNPMSGHFSALFEDFYAGLLSHFDVFVAEWADARDVPATAGTFTIDDQIMVIEDDIRHLGPGLHIAAFSQSTVPATAAAALAAAADAAAAPRSLTLIAGPLDTRVNPNPVNQFIAGHPLAWFDSHLTAEVPFYYRGAGRRVFPGFYQLAGYITASIDDQVDAHFAFFESLARGDGDSAQAHRDFYDRFLAVMDLPAEFFRDMVARVFRDAALARGALEVGGRPVDTTALRDTALFTAEAGEDDLAAPGQTHAAHDFCTTVAAQRRRRITVDGVGHIGLVHGRRWRHEVLPAMVEFIDSHG
jgi:poly(3-hydroxybutyrate) depolymerase